MLNALLNLLLFYNKIYAFHLVAVVAVARRQKVHSRRVEERGRERVNSTWAYPDGSATELKIFSTK